MEEYFWSFWSKRKSKKRYQALSTFLSFCPFFCLFPKVRNSLTEIPFHGGYELAFGSGGGDDTSRAA